MTDAKTPPRRPRRHLRRALWGLLALLAVAAAAHGLAWRWASSALAVGFSDWVTQRRAEGWQVAHAPPARGGWPLAARLTVPDLMLEAPSRRGQAGVAHQAARVVLQLTPARPDRLEILFEGPQRLVLGGASLPFAAEHLAVEVPLAPGPPALRVEARRLAALLPDGALRLRSAQVTVQPATAGGAGAARAAEGEPGTAIMLRAEGLALPPSAAAQALGPEVDAVLAEALLLGPLPPPGPPAFAAAAWRDAGGTLDIRRLALRWGALDAEARLQLALDAALQPAGSGTLSVAGAAGAIDALARAGLLAGNAARTAQGVVALLGRVPPEGGPPRIEVPVALAQGTLSMARLPLLRVPPIAWPPPR